MVPGCAHNGRAVHYAVTADYRPPILTVPRTGGHQAPWDWSSPDDGARRRSLECVNYRNFIVMEPLCCLLCQSVVLLPQVRTVQERKPHAPAGAEPNPTSEGQRNPRNTHCDTGTPTKKDKVQRCAGQQWTTGLCRKYRIHKNPRDIFAEFVCGIFTFHFDGD